MLNIPERVSAMVTATNLQGRLGANAWRRDGGGKTGKHGAQNENLVITITRNKIRIACKTMNGSFIIAACE
jgi:D-alanyl-D-alanine carboxypeptidase